MAAAIAKLAGLGIPPVFCLVFDLFWVPAFRLSRIVNAALGADHAILPGIWIWHVDPAKAESGWHPHRDIGHEALFPDRRPRTLTAWLALTDATPLNGCMYVVPAERDPTYGTPEDSRHAFALPDVRALPADAGDVLVWNQALLHWGSHASPLALAPRMSMSFEFAHEAAECQGMPPIDPAAKCQGNPAACRRKYVREEKLEAQFTELLGRLRFDEEVLAWVREALHASHADQRQEHQTAIERLRAEHTRLGERINAMYIDKLDGKIGGDFFDRFAGEWRAEQNRLQREIDRHEVAEQSYMEEGVQILELARNAQGLFERQEPRQKRRLLNFLLSNCSWEDGEVRATFRQPFDLLAETTAIAARQKAGSATNSAKSEIWLGDQDSNLD